jgi:hypothetical protein
MKVTVVSTGFNVEHKAVCLSSVKKQKAPGLEVEHRWVDAAMQLNPKTCAENLRALIRNLPADRVVAWLDLDDWMANPNALARAVLEHQKGAWVTYGSFMHADGQVVRIQPYEKEGWNELRSAPWAASHLKTFRAGLFNRIADDDLEMYGEEWLERAVDLAIMYPLLEMAGPDRTVFIEDILYVYNYSSSTDANASPEVLAKQRECVRHVRGKKPYKRIGTL